MFINAVALRLIHEYRAQPVGKEDHVQYSWIARPVGKERQ